MSTILIERDDVVWTITINRPEVRNAVDGPTAHALAAAFRAFDADAQVAPQRELEPACDGVAFDGRDHRLAQA